MKRIVTMVALLVLSYSALAEQSGGAAPVIKNAAVGGTCQEEGTLNDIQATNPLICTNGSWRKVVFKVDGKGAAEPVFYEGKCSLRFTGPKDTKGKIVLKAGDMADICLPAGWIVLMGATSDSMDWVYHRPEAMPNIVLIKATQPGLKSMFWIYPKNSDGKSPQKFEIELRSTK
jgi:hypothetical protein